MNKRHNLFELLNSDLDVPDCDDESEFPVLSGDGGGEGNNKRI